MQERQPGAQPDEYRQGQLEGQPEKQRQGQLERYLERCLERYFARRLDPERIRRHLRAALQKAPPVPTPAGTAGWPRPAPGLVRVSCVQRRIRPVRSAEEYVDHLHGFVREAAARGSRLVVFPEYNFFDLFGLLPGFAQVDRLSNARAQASLGRSAAQAGAEAAASGGAGEPDPGGAGSGRPGLSAPGRGGACTSGRGRPAPLEPDRGQAGPPSRLLYALFSALARPAEAALLALMGELARRYGLYVYTGTYLLKEGGRLDNAGSLLGPDGEVIGTQKKIHLMDFEADLGLARGDRLEVRDLAGIGRVAFPVCMDATYFETFHLAGQAGAEVVLLPIANSEEYHPWKALRGIWPRVQESYLFGLKASLNGWLGGMHFTGKAGIFAPLELTERRDGILALAGHWEGDELVTADLDLAALRRAREEAEYWGDANPAFEAGYWARTYGRGDSLMKGRFS